MRSWLGLLAWLALALGGRPAFCAEKVQPFTGITLGGEAFDAAKYLGKVPMVIDFGSIYCSSCVRSIPHLANLQNRYGPDRLRVVAVNLDTYGVARVRRFYGQFRDTLSFPVVLDLRLEISRQFGVTTLPTYVVVDRRGRAVRTVIGYDEQRWKELEAAVDRVVEEAPPGEEAPGAAGDVVILSPDNFTKTFQDSISVVGLTGGREGTFTLRLNGGSEKAARVYGRMFYVRTPLSLGSNYIEILYDEPGGTRGNLAIVMFREPVMGEGLESPFPEFQFHTPEHEQRCSGCHQMESGGRGEAAVITTFCLRCHGYLTDQAWVHGPIPVGGCSPCHDFTSKPHRYELVSRGADLCFTCHDDVREEFAKPYVHGPVAMGMCTVCHSPHGSPFKYQIRLPQGDLCLSCHEGMKEKMSRFVLHKPFGEGKCTGCHDPHASDNPHYFLKGEGEALCRLCHSAEQLARHKHPVGRPPKFTVKGMRLDRNGNLTCLSCHDPHATDNQWMAPVPGGCSGCHRM